MAETNVVPFPLQGQPPARSGLDDARKVEKLGCFKDEQNMFVAVKRLRLYI
jgi:hypothetical protein